MNRSFRDRMARLEALERTHQLAAAPAYACMHSADFDALTDLATPPALVDAIAAEYQLSDNQKLYVACCLCWHPDERCRVCADTPFIGEHSYV